MLTERKAAIALFAPVAAWRSSKLGIERGGERECITEKGINLGLCQ